MKKAIAHNPMLALVVTALGIVLVLGLSACSGQNSSGSSSGSGSGSQGGQSADSSQVSSQDSTESQDGNQSGTKKNLVVYFSATGHTKSVAEGIADAANADLVELVPSDPYTDDDLDYSDEKSRVNREHDNESLRDVALESTEVPNWDSYNTVFIGYPIWWGGAAWPIDSFVKNNDFSGKTVIPFATSASSGMGDSGSDLAKLADTGDWQDGQRFSSDVSADEVKEWIDGLRCF